MKKLTGPTLLVGTPAEFSNLRYASGFAAVDPVVFLMARATAYLLVPVLEKGRAEKEAHPGVRVVTPEELKLRGPQRRRLSCWVLALLQHGRTKHVSVSPLFPVGIAKYLETNGIRVSVTKHLAYEQRAVKSPKEVRCIRSAQRAAADAMNAAIRFLKSARIDSKGYLLAHDKRVYAKDLRALIDLKLIERDCTGSGTIVACGRQSADPHERGHGALRAHQPIVIDIFPQNRTSGYWGDMTRTVVRGQASEEVREMFAAVKAAQKNAIRRVRANIKAATIHHVVCEEFEKRGFETRLQNGHPEGFIHSTGHGVGLDIHEAPAVSSSEQRLRAGHVITVEPGLYYPEFGGVRIEDTVLVTREGCRSLACVNTRLEI